MFSIISPILLVLVIAISLATKGWHRFKCALCLLIPTSLHFIFFDHLETANYYLTAMAFNSMTIALLEMVKRGVATRLIVHLQLFSFAIMLTNFVGVIMWFLYMSPEWYNAVWLTLAIAEAARLFLRTGGDKTDGIDNYNHNWIGNDSKRGLGGRV